MSKYRAEQDICISGWECGTEIEMKLVVEYSMTEHYPASDDGPEEFPQPDDITLRFFRKGIEVDLPSWVEEEFVNSDEFTSWLIAEADETNLCAAEDAADHKSEMMRDEGRA